MSASTEETPLLAESRVILIAEDEESIALTLSYIVEDLGYLPLIAAQGQEALELACTRHPVLIITDLMMPRMSGRELIAALRQGATDAPRTPIILTTAAGAAYISDIDADAVLPKPFDIATVEALLQRFLG